MKNARGGTTLTELMLAVAVLSVIAIGLSGLLKYTGIAVSRAQNTGQAQEETRQALMLIEDALIHANDVRVASTTYVEFTLDIEHAPAYDRNADAGQNDGVISAVEMDAVLAPAGMGNRNGALDLANERRYITSIRLALAVDRNKDGKNDYALETDVYPPLLPLKSR